MYEQAFYMVVGGDLEGDEWCDGGGLDFFVV